MQTCYKHSGKAPPIGVLLGLTGGVLAVIPLSFAYAYGIIHIPEVKLRAICTIAFGVLVGVATGLGMVWGKVRNNFVAVGAGLLTSLAALYVSWGIWILDIISPGKWGLDSTKLLTSPQLIWQIILAINPRGTWGLQHEAPMRGIPLWIIWASEASLILLCGILVAVALVRRKPFCENCDQWCSGPEKLYYAPSVDSADLKAKIENQQFSDIQKLVQGDPKAAKAQIHLHACSTCGRLNTLTLIRSTAGSRKILFNKLLISDSDAGFLGRQKPVTAMQASVGGSL
jgi:hypothetical protein